MGMIIEKMQMKQGNGPIRTMSGKRGENMIQIALETDGL